MSALLADKLAGETFALKDDLVAALALITPSVKTVADLKAFDGERLQSVPANPATVTSLLTLCTAHRATILDDLAGRTALGALLGIILRSESSAAGRAAGAPATVSKAVLEAAGKAGYDHLTKTMVSRVRNRDRFDYDLVKKLADALDSGSFPRSSYELKSLKVLGTPSVEGAATVGGLPVTTATQAEQDLSGLGLVLLHVWRWTRFVLGAGYREISPNTPGVASVGTAGSLTYKDAAAPGGKSTKRYYITPDEADQYFAAALLGSTVLTAAQLVRAHMWLCAAMADLVGASWNLASAMITTIDKTSFAEAACKEVPPPSVEVPSPQLSQAGSSVTVLEAENKDLKRQLSNERNTSAQLRASASGGKKPRPAEQSSTTCYKFQETGKCAAGDSCPFKAGHVCMRCGAADHGVKTCTK
jgi:hypothetical protein